MEHEFVCAGCGEPVQLVNGQYERGCACPEDTGIVASMSATCRGAARVNAERSREDA